MPAHFRVHYVKSTTVFFEINAEDPCRWCPVGMRQNSVTGGWEEEGFGDMLRFPKHLARFSPKDRTELSKRIFSVPGF